eukprot:SAG11_NODE_365_length_10153_cov_3.204695_2_plen_182_part_00
MARSLCLLAVCATLFVSSAYGANGNFRAHPPNPKKAWYRPTEGKNAPTAVGLEACIYIMRGGDCGGFHSSHRDVIEAHEIQHNMKGESDKFLCEETSHALKQNKDTLPEMQKLMATRDGKEADASVKLQKPRQELCECAPEIPRHCVPVCQNAHSCCRNSVFDSDSSLAFTVHVARSCYQY